MEQFIQLSTNTDIVNSGIYRKLPEEVADSERKAQLLLEEVTEHDSTESLLEELLLVIDRVKELGKKNTKDQNVSAGVTMRHELRDAAKICNKLVKVSYESDKKLIEMRRQKRLTPQKPSARQKETG